MPNPPDSEVRKMLQKAKVIAVVGHSDNPFRTSYQIAAFLRQVGYKVYPVNPTITEVNGERSYPSVADVPEAVDIVDVFRRSEFLEDVVEDAIKAGAKNIWAQIGVYDEAAGEKAAQAGMGVVLDRCIKIEHLRLVR